MKRIFLIIMILTLILSAKEPGRTGCQEAYNLHIHYSELPSNGEFVESNFMYTSKDYLMVIASFMHMSEHCTLNDYTNLYEPENKELENITEKSDLLINQGLKLDRILAGDIALVNNVIKQFESARTKVGLIKRSKTNRFSLVITDVWYSQAIELLEVLKVSILDEEKRVKREE